MPLPRVVVVTATYRRATALADLLASLESERPALAGVIIVDNGSSAETAAVAARAGGSVRVISPTRNLGCGGGVAVGLREALREPGVTHGWIFDDDAQATPGALSALLADLERASADAAVPLVTDAGRAIGWFPGPLAPPAWNAIRSRGITPAEFRARCGDEPVPWAWAPWPSLLVTRRAVETVGLPRDDFWFQGEDIEWTLRITARFRGVLAPAAEARHFPPPGDRQRSRLKQAAMLQNNAYTATRLPHGRRILRHAAGNAWRFLSANGFGGGAISLLLWAHWSGAVCGRPAGAVGGDALRREWEKLP
ncbi:MAG: glycosyltransferase [Opitutus sp.]|nr:glycosyltransferase [Opitutus sp.]